MTYSLPIDSIILQLQYNFDKSNNLLEMGHPNLIVELRRALKSGIRDLYTCTRSPPVYSFEREMVEGLTIILKLF